MKDALYKIKKEYYFKYLFFSNKLLYVLTTIILTVSCLITLSIFDKYFNVSFSITVLKICVIILSILGIGLLYIIDVINALNEIKKSVEKLYFITGVLLDFDYIDEVNPIAEVETRDGVFIVSTFCGITSDDIGSSVIIFSYSNDGFEKPYKLSDKVAIVLRKFEKYEFNC